MECLLFTVSVMSGAPLCLQTRHGKRRRGTQAMLRLFGGVGEGGISVWRWIPAQTIPPVVDQVAGTSAMRA